MDMNRSQPTGFTLVELLMGILASVIVLLGTVSILVGAQKSWRLAWERMMLQNDASIAMLWMTHTVRPGTSIEVSESGNEIKVYGKNGWTRFFHSDGTNDLQCEVKGGPVHTIINDTVQSLSFVQQTSLLKIQMSLQRDDIRSTLATSVMMRNTGG